jgi:hypothetical protein
MSDALDALRRTFNLAAAVYEAARPSYLSELFDDLVELAGLQKGDRLLEIGCATGQQLAPDIAPLHLLPRTPLVDAGAKVQA